MKKAVYPGSFDPMTCGHLDILQRSLNIFDEVIILPASNSTKQSLFTTQQRIDQIQRIIEAEHISDRVRVDTFDGLLVDYCTKNGIFT
ncbi:MAG: adenylyltransferase/cytidyltransferase family protein, partial [Spirochaetales bacterium]|nr:adenylyltransferase/cytidyltransferase family protein [Spirochaetales bacterium]